jgi:hypothetical protein
VTVPETLSTPTTLLDWLAEMRGHASLGPMLVVVRDERLIASGFIGPNFWPHVAGVAFYGFEADVLAFTMDAWSYAGELPPFVTPEERFAAGDPNATEALYVQWIPRAGPARIIGRRYVDTGTGIDWFDPEDLPDEIVEFLGPAHVRADVIRQALAEMAQRYDRHDAFKSVGTQADRDRTTARYLGMELRT